MTNLTRNEMMKYRTLALVLTLFVALAGCGDDSNRSNNGANNGVDAGSDAGDQDVQTMGDVSGGDTLDHRCGDAPLQDWPLHDATADGTVETTEDAGTMTATIDAAAGGMQAAANNPYIYLDLSTGEKVAVDDVTAFKDGGWDLAFKRTIIRTNSEDSGPGDVSVAKMSDTTFADVTAAPDSSAQWAQDVTYDENCGFLTDPIGQPVTAFNYLNQDNPTGSQSWYDYSGGITPHAGDIYIVDVPSRSTTYKLEIQAWESGVFTIQWAEL